MERLRRILVERYIGLVMVCAFVSEALVMAGRVLQYPFGNLVIWIYNANRPHDTLALSEPGAPPGWYTAWELSYLSIPLLLAVLTYRWLCVRTTRVADAEESTHEES